MDKTATIKETAHMLLDWAKYDNKVKAKIIARRLGRVKLISWDKAKTSKPIIKMVLDDNQNSTIKELSQLIYEKIADV
jgi:hypothetical protein